MRAFLFIVALFYSFNSLFAQQDSIPPPPPVPKIFVYTPPPIEESPYYDRVKDLPLKLDQIAVVDNLEDLLRNIQDNKAVLVKGGTYDLADFEKIERKFWGVGKLNYDYEGICNSFFGEISIVVSGLEHAAIMAFDPKDPPKFVNTSFYKHNFSFIYAKHIILKDLDFAFKHEMDDEYLSFVKSNNLSIQSCSFYGPKESPKGLKSQSFALNFVECVDVEIDSIETDGFLNALIDIDFCLYLNISNASFKNMQYQTTPIRICYSNNVKMKNLYFENIQPYNSAVNLPLFHTINVEKSSIEGISIKDAKISKLQLKTGIFGTIYKHKKDLKVKRLKKK